MTQVPATLSNDLRDRPPHLRPWRDGWRHLRYLLMLSPTWVFGVPAMALLGLGSMILLLTMLTYVGLADITYFGEGWTIVAGTMVIIGHMAGIIAVTAHLNGVKAGYRLPHLWLWRLRSVLSLEGLLISGGAFVLLAGVGLVGIAAYWSASSFAALPTVLPIVLCSCLGAIGMQNVLGGFMLAIIGGHEAMFLNPLTRDREVGEPAALPVRG